MPQATILEAGERLKAMGPVERREALLGNYGHLCGQDLISSLLGPKAPLRGQTALVSSFGAESVVLLHMVSQVDRDIPVIFLDTLAHFPATLAYRGLLVEQLGLRDVRDARPDLRMLGRIDPIGNLHAHDPDLCCHFRKTEPLDEALSGFDAWITGRKRFQGGARDNLPVFEVEDGSGRIKINPLAQWSSEDLEAYRASYDLPAHPLVAEGYRSIGCAPCTRPVAEGEDPRAGRWAGTSKTECGIHVSHGGGI
ncbi:MAG TPA: phosphoadenylyl-sulfate reductase [Geminicoccus sp.]|jgi:phosphoadenosine phosphosulfate reductase|uniref:phosphoadenylyl-sulfate reductase n=1 Tax=Geminicoccus sp. TaxID=2024832 RepID=UPI002E366C03|nr:phosphoadenylyl-sulfate reductase [Geminicoccus sp.]HEX2526186.1 phosphoadenylyl-sulfate reductase [Geminicoccus sp.]